MSITNLTALNGDMESYPKSTIKETITEEESTSIFGDEEITSADENMLEISDCSVEINNVSNYVSREYDENGNPTEKTTYDENGNRTSYYAWQRDENGNLISGKIYDQYTEYSYKYEYDENGNQTKIINYNENGDVTGSTEYEYDEFGRNILETLYGSDGNLLYSIEWTGNENEAEKENVRTEKQIEFVQETLSDSIKRATPNFNGPI